MREYEIMFIFDPAEERVTSLKDTVKGFITEAGGEIVNEEDMGLRKLSYPIKKRERGFYYLLYCNIDPERVNTDINREVNLQEDILKYMAIRKTKEK